MTNFAALFIFIHKKLTAGGKAAIIFLEIVAGMRVKRDIYKEIYMQRKIYAEIYA
jgi:hypothetical protein